MLDMPILCALVFMVALLYSAVGHGGASGYLASMALLGVTTAIMKPTALLLNILVSAVGSFRYVRHDCFSLKVFLPFALGAVPFAFLGGLTTTPDQIYRKVLGAALLVAAVGLIVSMKREPPARSLHPLAGAAIGAGIGYVSGLIGVGGGIFLSPILVLTGWATTRQALGISALFILVNSVAGTLGNLGGLMDVPVQWLWLIPFAFIGGLLGSFLGAKKTPPSWLRVLMGLTVLIAALKLLVT